MALLPRNILTFLLGDLTTYLLFNLSILFPCNSFSDCRDFRSTFPFQRCCVLTIVNSLARWFVNGIAVLDTNGATLSIIDCSTRSFLNCFTDWSILSSTFSFIYCVTLSILNNIANLFSEVRTFTFILCMTLILIYDVHTSLIGSMRHRSLNSITFSSRIAATYFIILCPTFFLVLGSCDRLLLRPTLLVVHCVTLTFSFMFYMRLLHFLTDSIVFCLTNIIANVRTAGKAKNHSKYMNLHNDVAGMSDFTVAEEKRYSPC